MLETLKTFDASDLPTVFPGVATANLQPTARARSIRTKCDRRRFISARNSSRAAQHIKKLPARGESVHLLLSPNSYAVFDLLPACIDMAGRPATEVWLSSLGIASRHIESLDTLITSGRIKRAGLLLSNYFSRVDQGEYQQAVETFTRHGFPVGECRSHAKVLALRFGTSRHVVIESSGNLRSCRAAEIATLTDDARLFRWHRSWIKSLLEGKS